MAWKLVRQDTHGSRFDVATFEFEADAIAAMAQYESGYPHHQTYYVENTQRYDPNLIEVLPGLEAVRRRPEMYVGADGLHRNDAVFEAMCLALTEAHCGTCTSISIAVSGDTIQIVDNGLGLSLEPNHRAMPFAEEAMTVLGACRDHKEHERLKWELCGVGLAVVNALSSSASLEISDGDQLHQQT